MLRGKSTAPRDQLDALKFVAHFVADVHQPLHAANDGDRGGNDARVILDRAADEPARGVGHRHPVHCRDRRRARLCGAAGAIDQADQARSMSRRSVATWATESNDIARRLLYGEWPHGPDALRASYKDLARPVVNEKLVKAGVRLAAALNDALK